MTIYNSKWVILTRSIPVCDQPYYKIKENLPHWEELENLRNYALCLILESIYRSLSEQPGWRIDNVCGALCLHVPAHDRLSRHSLQDFRYCTWNLSECLTLNLKNIDISFGEQCFTYKDMFLPFVQPTCGKHDFKSRHCFGSLFMCASFRPRVWSCL